ncbi:MAG: glutathione S-transferase N-terminal domain-containing protein [Aquisalimonadaceae bacterium]
MKLYCSKNSPYARKARVSIIELGISDRVELIETDPRDPSTGLWSLNPLAKIPVLATDDGDIIFDSPVICDYLNQVAGDGRLLPTEPASRWRATTLAALADGVMDAAMAVRLERQRPEGEQSPAWMEKQLARAGRALDALQDALPDFQDRVDLVSIGTACAITWVMFRLPDHDWLGPRPRLAAWHAEYCKRDAMQRTMPEIPLKP